MNTTDHDVNICLELTPFEAGILLGVLTKMINESDASIYSTMWKRLSDLCIDKYYKE